MAEKGGNKKDSKPEKSSGRSKPGLSAEEKAEIREVGSGKKSFTFTPREEGRDTDSGKKGFGRKGDYSKDSDRDSKRSSYKSDKEGKESRDTKFRKSGKDEDYSRDDKRAYKPGNRKDDSGKSKFSKEDSYFSERKGKKPSFFDEEKKDDFRKSRFTKDDDRKGDFRKSKFSKDDDRKEDFRKSKYSDKNEDLGDRRRRRTDTYSKNEDDFAPERKTKRADFNKDERKTGFRSSGKSDFAQDRPQRRSSGGDKKPYGKSSKRDSDDYGNRSGKEYHSEWMEDVPQKWKNPKSSDRKKKAPTLEESDGKIRLNKYIANAGVCSRREADDLIKSGAVKVNGKIITEMGYRISPSDKVQYGDETLNRETKRYLLLNKPKDYITTSSDPSGRKTVMELVSKACRERLYPVGRLDRATTGLLLMTNDGDLAKRLTHPSHGVKKVYHVTLNKNLKAVDMKRIMEGVELEDGTTGVDSINYVGDGSGQVGSRR
ncbi:MAG: pseudouridine synthase [Bacteroidia bacterium]